ncbi:MAG: calcium-binding protein [Myxococcales bacterium]|nr:calcium-binding protein [Myxococcales bacterium]
MVGTGVGCDPADPANLEGVDDAESLECEDVGVERECVADEGQGTQYCDYIEGYQEWGPCLVKPRCIPGRQYSCGLGGEFADWTRSCELVEGVPELSDDGCDTPLVLSFDSREPEYFPSWTSLSTFDISGTRGCNTTSWPTPTTPWLAIDLDKNGAIDGGHELFGTGSLLVSGRHASNGFEALSELDSNGDSVISPADDRFAELLLWSDYDGDRRSTGWELVPLASRGVDSIALGYEQRRVCDASGNCGIERSAFSFSGFKGQVIDVHLTCQ